MPSTEDWGMPPSRRAVWAYEPLGGETGHMIDGRGGLKSLPLPLDEPPHPPTGGYGKGQPPLGTRPQLFDEGPGHTIDGGGSLMSTS
jgi:hypothetical protein